MDHDVPEAFSDRYDSDTRSGFGSTSLYGVRSGNTERSCEQGSGAFVCILPPHVSPSNLMQRIKGRSSRRLLERTKNCYGAILANWLFKHGIRKKRDSVANFYTL